MSRKGLKAVVELHLRAVTCPGVHLPAKDDIYLSVCLMNQYMKSECLPPVFPSLFQMKLRFEKVFKHATDPADIAEILHMERVKIELIQLIPPVGEVLARYDVDARTFLFPEPKLVPSFSGIDREVLMTRNSSFPGISPRLEFSTRTKISECLEDATFQIFPLRLITRKAKKVKHQSSFSAPRSFRNTVQETEVLSSDSDKTNSRHLPRDSSCSDTEDLLDYSQEPCQCPCLSGYEGSPSSATLSHSNRTSLRHNSYQLFSSNSWEEVQERVRGLLTSPQAVHRLAHGATVSETDEVLVRCFISQHL